MNKVLFLFLILSYSFPLLSEDRLAFSSIFTEIPNTSKETLKESFSKESLPYWGIIAASTGLLIYYDEPIYSEAQKMGRNLNLGNEDQTKAFLSSGGFDFLRLPTDTGSALYFLGDGWMHGSIALGFLGAGHLSKNDYHYNTGIMIMHGMIVSTIFNQTLKRSFGRESPYVKTHERGLWRPFPSFNTYNTQTSSYDAMPSGHVMVSTLTFTILAERYPEYRTEIYSVGGAWITALAFQMVNNGVHWASDYPLGIAMGYVVGKLSTKIGQKMKTSEEKEQSWTIIPAIGEDVQSLTFLKRF